MPARTQAIFMTAWLMTALLGIAIFILRIFGGF